MPNAEIGEFKQIPRNVLGASQNFKKRLLASPCLLVRPSARNNSEPTGRIFMNVVIWAYFENRSIKFNLNWNLTTTAGTLHEQLWNLWQNFAQFCLEWEMLQTKHVNKIKAHILFIILFSDNGAVYEILCKVW